MEIDTLTQVLRLHARGLAVFPVDIATKRPLVQWGGLNATRATDEQVRGWNWTNCAVGVACGPVSGLFALDLDFAKHPEAKQFYESHTFPRTWKEKTASGGAHLLFKWTDALNLKKTQTASIICKGVDTRGAGGYVKVTPSPGYEWVVAPHTAPLASLPQWLIDLLPNKETTEIVDEFVRKPDGWMIRALENIDPADPVNGRTPTFVGAIGRLKAKGLDQLEVLGLLKPWADRYQYPKLAALVDDQFQRYPPRMDPNATSTSPLLTNHSFKSFMAHKKKIPFIVDEVIHENTISVMAGLQEARKSWLMLDLAIALASGTPWLGKFKTRRSRVLIIDQERPVEEMQRRLDALAAARKLTEDDFEGFLIPKASIEPPFKLNNDQSYALFEKMVDDVRPNVLLIDSLKASQSGDINSSNDMQKVFERLKALRLKYGLTIVILHHENKGRYEAIREKHTVTAEKIEGSGVINQVPEEIFVAVPYDGESSFFYHVKNSYGMKVPPFLVKVRDVKPDQSEIAVEAF